MIDEVIDRKDQAVPRRSLGGPISYCSVSLKALGYQPEIVTHVGDNFPKDYSELLKTKAGIDLEEWKSQGFKTTSYRIDRSKEHRELWLVFKCKELEMTDFDSYFSGQLRADALVVDPVANEVSLSLLQKLTKRFQKVFIDSQGFVRQFSSDGGKVGIRQGLDISSLEGVSYLKTDLEEMSAWVGTDSKETGLQELSKFVKTILLTSGPSTVEVYQRGALVLTATPFKVRVADTTGAGDIMLSSFAARYCETEDLEDSLRFALSASTLAVRNFGIEKALLNKTEVEKSMHQIKIERLRAIQSS